jgi:hypothetical protein
MVLMIGKLILKDLQKYLNIWNKALSKALWIPWCFPLKLGEILLRLCGKRRNFYFTMRTSKEYTIDTK